MGNLGELCIVNISTESTPLKNNKMTGRLSGNGVTQEVFRLPPGWTLRYCMVAGLRGRTPDVVQLYVWSSPRL